MDEMQESQAPPETFSPNPGTPDPEPAAEPVVAEEDHGVEFREGTKGDQGEWVTTPDDDEPKE